MIKKWYIIVAAIFVYSGIIFPELYACMITFINDSNGTIMIHDKNDKINFFIKKYGRRRFGRADKHARFDVCIKQSQPTDSFKVLYSCEQHSCGKNSNPHIKFSDLEHGKGAVDLFTVIKDENPHRPMVRELPIFQKSGCGACADD